MSYFKEIGILDRPFIPITVKIHNQDVPVRVKALSAKDQDGLEALNMDEYGAALERLTSAGSGELSEVDRVERIYSTKSVRELVDQIIPTRQDEITSRALEICHLDVRQEIALMSDMEEEERKKYSAEQDARLNTARVEAEAQLRSELSVQSVETLAHTMAQVNVNLKALNEAANVTNAAAVYYCLYKPEEDVRCFNSVDEVREELGAPAIRTIAIQAQKAIQTDIPFVSLDDAEHNKQQSSQSTSEEATEDGGTPTTTTPEDSTASSTPA